MRADPRTTIRLPQIPAAGLDLDEHFEPAWTSRAMADDDGDPFRAVAGTRLQGRLSRQGVGGVTIRLTGTLTTEVEYDCVRCLDPLRLPLEVPIDRLFVPAGRLGTDASGGGAKAAGTAVSTAKHGGIEARNGGVHGGSSGPRSSADRQGPKDLEVWVASPEVDDDDIELGAADEEADVIPYVNETLDLAPVLAEELRFALPMRPVIDTDDQDRCRACQRTGAQALAALRGESPVEAPTRLGQLLAEQMNKNASPRSMSGKTDRKREPGKKR